MEEFRAAAGIVAREGGDLGLHLGRRLGLNVEGVPGAHWARVARYVDIGQFVVQIYRMQAVSYSEARENLKAMIDKVVADRAPLAITRQRGEGAVLISASEWASIEETLYLLQSPRNAERLLEAVRGFEAGDAGVDQKGDPLP